MSIDAIYTAEALATGDGRNGHVRSSDGLLDADVAIPAEMGGKGGATNPEQLFAAGYAACFHSALRNVASMAKVRLGADTTVAATVGLGPNGAGGYGLEVALTAHLPGLDLVEAEKLVEQAHQVCPYSNATRGNVDVTLTTTV
jgi:osmotically inducible protein OsmC